MYMTSKELKVACESYGSVAHARVMGSQCYGFVEFTDAEECDKVLAEMKVRPIRVGGDELRVCRARGVMPGWQ